MAKMAMFEVAFNEKGSMEVTEVIRVVASDAAQAVPRAWKKLRRYESSRDLFAASVKLLGVESD